MDAARKGRERLRVKAIKLINRLAQLGVDSIDAQPEVDACSSKRYMPEWIPS